MSRKAKITVNPAFEIGDISPRLYSAFLEPIGNMVTGLLFDPKHPTADEHGFRTDYINALKATDLPAVRLPGGNFMSGWDWKDSIGPKDQRKSHLDLAWHQYYTNEVGHDEYLQWAEKVGFEPMYTINLGTGDINDAVYITEYTNHEGGTYWSDLRRKNGHEAPYGVKTWYIGNEMDGPWQIGSWERDPKGYGIRVNEVSKAMKWVDGSIETGVCVSCSPTLAHYPQWDLDVLQECYETVDYISMHQYQAVPPDDISWQLGASVYFEDYINTEVAICDYVQTKCRSPKKMLLSFDEYAMMTNKFRQPEPGAGPHAIYKASYNFKPRPYIRHDPDKLAHGGGFMMGHHGDISTALGSASILLAFLRHADRVKIGCMTFGLGALVSMDYEHAWRSGVYYPYAQLMRYGRGTSLRVGVDCDTFDIPAYASDETNECQGKNGVAYIDSACAFDKANGELNLFVINRHADTDTSVDIDVSGFEGYKFVEQIQMYTEDPEAANTWENPNAVVPTIAKDAKCENGIVSANLKAVSWNIFRFVKA